MQELSFHAVHGPRGTARVNNIPPPSLPLPPQESPPDTRGDYAFNIPGIIKSSLCSQRSQRPSRDRWELREAVLARTGAANGSNFTHLAPHSSQPPPGKGKGVQAVDG